MINKNTNSVDYIIVRAEIESVKIIIKKKDDIVEETLEKGEVFILRLLEDIESFKIKGRARIVSKLDQVISE